MVVYDAPGNERLKRFAKIVTRVKMSHYYAVKLLFRRDFSAVAKDRSDYAVNIVKRDILIQVTICN